MLNPPDVEAPSEYFHDKRPLESSVDLFETVLAEE